MKIYLIEGYRSWYLAKACNKREARSDGVREFGRGMVRAVREATEIEVKDYMAQRGEISEVGKR